MSDKALNKSNNNPNKKKSKPLSKNAQKFLRGVAHDIKPVVTVADKGLTENIMIELDICLDQHELVKVKLRTDRETRQQYAETIITETSALKIQSIGQTLTIYRANPKKPIYELPK